MVAGRTTVRLTVCIDPAAPHRAAPGTYVGTVALDDDALASPVVAALSVSLTYEDFYGPLVLTLLAVVAATYLAALADPEPKPVRAWVQDHEHLSAAVFTAAAAGITAHAAGKNAALSSRPRP